MTQPLKKPEYPKKPEKDYQTSPKGRIKIYPSYLLIPGSKALGTEDTIVRERTMLEYQTFYENWQTAANVMLEHPKSTFSSMWLKSNLFRDLCTRALMAVGIENPKNLKPAQLAELLFDCKLDDGLSYGLIFRLHQDFPVLGEKTTEGASEEDAPKLTFLSRLGF